MTASSPFSPKPFPPPLISSDSPALSNKRHTFSSNPQANANSHTPQADVYSNGRSEEIIAKAISRYSIPRSKLVLLSKCYFGVDPSGAQPSIAAVSTNDGAMVNQVGLSRKHIFDAVEASVKRLGTYIDVLQIHRLDRNVDREEIMKALNDVVERGWVRYIGASSVSLSLFFLGVW